MVIRRIAAQPELANRIFLEVGRKELKFILNFGFVLRLRSSASRSRSSPTRSRSGGCCRSAA